MDAAEHKAAAEEILMRLSVPDSNGVITPNALGAEWQIAHIHAILATIPDN